MIPRLCVFATDESLELVDSSGSCGSRDWWTMLELRFDVVVGNLNLRRRGSGQRILDEGGFLSEQRSETERINPDLEMRRVKDRTSLLARFLGLARYLFY